MMLIEKEGSIIVTRLKDTGNTTKEKMSKIMSGGGRIVNNQQMVIQAS